MTDNETIKRAEHFADKFCENCNIKDSGFCDNCIGKILNDLIGIDKRQREEIERLTTENAELEAEAENQYEQARADILGNMANGGVSCHWCIDEHKKNAVKDFAERLKAKATYLEYLLEDWDELALKIVEFDEIDALVAEMEEKQ